MQVRSLALTLRPCASPQILEWFTLVPCPDIANAFPFLLYGHSFQKFRMDNGIKYKFHREIQDIRVLTFCPNLDKANQLLCSI